MKIRKNRRFCPEPPKQLPTKLKRYSGPIAIVLTVVFFAVPFSLLSSNYLFRPSMQPLPVVNVAPSFINSTLASNWISTFGTGLSDSASNVIQTSDYGFAVIGTLGNGYAPDTAMLVKIDSSGRMLWNQTYTYLSTGIAVVQTSDGGYTVAGNGNGGFMLLRIDQKGNAVWNQTYTVSFQGSGGGDVLSMIQTSDGGYIVVGACTPYLLGEGSNNGFALKTDSSGKVQWSKTYGGSGIDFFRSVIQTSDGNYVLAGYTTSFGVGGFDAWLVEINASGNQVWSKTYGEGPKSSPTQPQIETAGDDGANAVVQTSDDGFALAGYTYSYGTVDSRNAWLIKTDTSGNVEWSKTYTMEGQSTANALVRTSDDGLAFAGSTSNSTNWGFVDDMWVVKTDSAGNEQWNQAFGGMTGTPDSDVANSLTEASDGSFVLAGSTNPGSTAHGGYFYIVKTLPVSQSQLVAQSFGNVTINADGSVTGASIQRNGNVYTLTGNISGGISVQKSYVVIDGAGFTINGSGQYIGVDLGNGVGQDPSRSSICNVTVENLRMINCYYAIGSENTYNNTFIGNYIEGCDTGFWIIGSANNTLIHNTVKNCTTGISINYGSGGNVIVENNILSSWSVWLSPDPVVDRNYWGDYITRFPNATEIDNSGVWDTPYSHGDKIIDYHPLTDPVVVPVANDNSVSGDFWVERAPMPDAHIFLEAVTIDEKIFVIGSNYTVTSNSNYMYDPLTNTWASKTPMNLYRGDFAVATFQGKIYVIGGFLGTSPQFIPTATAANEMYDPATDTWTNKTSLPAGEGFLQAATVNGKIYVMGGAAYNGKNYDINGTNQVYDPLSDSWQSLAPMPTPVFNFAMAAVGNKIYVMGGEEERLNGTANYSNQTQIYDTLTNTWSFGQPIPITTFSSGAVATTGNLAPIRIYYIGGTDDETWAHTNTGPCPTQIYDPQTDSWSTGASIPTPRASGFTLAVVNDTVYAIGGYDGVSESTVNEQYFPLDYKGPMLTQSPYPTQTPNPSPSVPEFPAWTTLSFLVITIALVGLIIFKQKRKMK